MITTPETRICASIADPASPLGCLMHNAAFEHLKLNFVYFALRVADVENAVKGMRALNIRGFSVSMPHKVRVMEYLDNVDETAKAIGAVNTILNDDGILTGYNSDWIGAMTALKEVTRIRDKDVLVVGAGGAARAILYGLSKEGARVKVINRTVAKAEELARRYGAEYGSLEQLKNLSDYDIIMNATAVGFEDANRSLVGRNSLSQEKTVFDVVSMPLESKLIKEAREIGCRTVPGWKMLLYQAVWQFEKYTGKKAPVEVMEKALKDRAEK